jgi:hypothetical protein
VIRKMAEGGAPNIGIAPESFKLTQERKYHYAEYLLKEPRLKEILCFEEPTPKNLVYIMLDLVARKLKPEWIVFRLVELKLYEVVITDSYPILECREVCVEKKGRKCLRKEQKCEEVNKNIESLVPSEELLRVCRSSNYRSNY